MPRDLRFKCRVPIAGVAGGGREAVQVAGLQWQRRGWGSSQATMLARRTQSVCSRPSESHTGI